MFSQSSKLLHDNFRIPMSELNFRGKFISKLKTSYFACNGDLNPPFEFSDAKAPVVEKNFAGDELIGIPAIFASGFGDVTVGVIGLGYTTHASSSMQDC